MATLRLEGAFRTGRIVSLWRGTACGFVLLWLALLIAVGQPNFDLTVYKPTLALHVLYGALALAYAGYLAIKRRLPGRTRMDWAAGGLMAVYVAAVAGSVYPRVSLEAALLVGGVLIAFYALHDFEFLSTGALIRALVVITGMLALLGLVGTLLQWLDWLRLVEAVEGKITFANLLPPTIRRTRSLADHPNVLAMILNLGLPFALAFVLRPSSRFDRRLGGATLLAGSLALFFTVSRGAWLGAAAGTAAFILLYASGGHRLFERAGALWRSPWRRALLLGLALMAALVAGGIISSRWESRPFWLFRDTASPRLDAIVTALDIFEERPVLGTGPYTFPFLYDSHGGEYGGTKIHPHNAYMNTLVDLGLAGGFVVVAGCAAVVLALRRALRPADRDRRALLAATAASLTTVAVHSLVDSPNNLSAALLTLAVVLVIAMRLSPKPAAPSGLLPAIPRLGVVALIPTLVVAWVVLDSSHAEYDESLRYLETRQIVYAAESAGRAAEDDPSLAAYQFNAGVAHALLYLEAPEGRRDPQALATAIRFLERGLEHEPRSALGYVNLALAQRLRGDAPAATEAARRALAHAPKDGTIALIAGTVLEWGGREDEAVASYAFAVSRDARLLQSPFWTTTPERAAMRPRVIGASDLTPCEVGEVATIYRSYADDLSALERDCRSLVDGAAAGVAERADLALLLYALGRYPEAHEMASEAVHRRPDDASLRTALAITGAYDGDVRSVRRALLQGAYLGNQEAKLLLALTYGSPPGSQIAGNLRLPMEEAEMPEKVVSLLRSAVRGGGAPHGEGRIEMDDVSQRYFLGFLYYHNSFLRESPSAMFIPGDWLDFDSPAPLAILEVLNSR